VARIVPRLSVRGDRVRVRIAVDSAADVTLRATLTGNIRRRRRALALGTARAHFAQSGRRTLTIKLSARARRALRSLRAGRIALVADVASAGGTATVRAVIRPGARR